MADWIKYVKALPTKPEVERLMELLQQDRFEVVGRLMAVWAWADDLTKTGLIRNAKHHDLDKIAGVTGFTSALEKCDWARVTEDGIRLVKFTRHMTQSAKVRALTRDRVARYREKPCNAEPLRNRRKEQKEGTEGSSSNGAAALRSFLTQEGFKGKQLETILAHPNTTSEQVQVAITNADILAKQRKLRGTRQAYIWTAIRDKYDRLKPKKRMLKGIFPEDDALNGDVANDG